MPVRDIRALQVPGEFGQMVVGHFRTTRFRVETGLAMAEIDHPQPLGNKDHGKATRWQRDVSDSRRAGDPGSAGRYVAG